MKKYKNIFDAIDADNIEAVKTFLPDRLEVKDEYDRTPLHYACLHNHDSVIRLLLKHGANVNTRDIYTSTPLHEVCWNGNIETVRLFLDHGADIEAKNKCGWTPLHKTCMNGNTAIAGLLLDYNADIEARDIDDKTPLHFACDNSRKSTSELLVSRGADPFLNDHLGLSALYYDNLRVKDASGYYIPHVKLLRQMREEYLSIQANQHVLNESKNTAALSSGWEMEM